MEEWKDIKGYEGLYQISNYGRVKSLNYNHTGKERILKPHVLNVYGKKRLQITLFKNSTKKFPIIGRLVYEAFVGNIEDGMQLNHIDEDPSNNKVENLNLMTPKENSNWGTRNQRLGETFKRNGKCSQPIDQIDPKTGEILNSFPSAKEAQRKLGFAQSNISRAANGGFLYKGEWHKITQMYGFIWKWKEKKE